MRYLITSIILLIPFLFYSQKLTPNLLSNSGAIKEDAQIKVSWTLGEFAIATIGSDPKLSQGVQQSKLQIETKVEDPYFLGKIKLFPNPTQQYLQLEITDEYKDLSAKIYDISGKLMYTRNEGLEKPFDLSKLPNSIYLFQLLKNDDIIYTAQIIKQ